MSYTIRHKSTGEFLAQLEDRENAKLIAEGQNRVGILCYVEDESENAINAIASIAWLVEADRCNAKGLRAVAGACRKRAELAGRGRSMMHLILTHELKYHRN